MKYHNYPTFKYKIFIVFHKVVESYRWKFDQLSHMIMRLNRYDKTLFMGSNKFLQWDQRLVPMLFIMNDSKAFRALN